MLSVYIICYLYLVLTYYFIYLIAERKKANISETIHITSLFSFGTFFISFTILFIIDFGIFPSSVIACIFAMLNILIPIISTTISFVFLKKIGWHYKWVLASTILLSIMGWFLYEMIASGDYVRLLT